MAMTEPPAPPPPSDWSSTWGILGLILAVAVLGGGVTALVLRGGDDGPETPSQAIAAESPGVESSQPLPTEGPVAAATCIAAPPRPLIGCVPSEVGPFTLIAWDNAPQLASTFNANQAIEVEFNRPGGEQVLHYLFAYDIPTEAVVEQGRYVGGFEATGFTVVGETLERGINVTRLVEDKEVLIWSNGLLMGVVEGPFDVASGFFLELPY
ncbi:MAG: hypothetical protein ACRDHM_07235 [Actinomycetota bacterium]